MGDECAKAHLCRDFTFAALLLGLAIGFPAALLLTPLAGDLLFGLKAADPMTYATAAFGDRRLECRRRHATFLGAGEWKISISGGQFPRWSHDGKELSASP